MKRLLVRLGTAVLGVLCLFGANLSFDRGFTTMSEVRQLDRMPPTTIEALANGPYRLSGEVSSANGLLTAPYSEREGLYVRYRLEEEYRDSDGNRKTRTLESGASSTLFNLTDDSGTVLVDPSLSTGQINWAIDQNYRRRSGDLIYSEWVLLPDQLVNLTGNYRPQDNKIVFFENAFNLPYIVADRALQVEGGRRLFTASILISIACTLASVGMALLLISVKVHRFWVYVLAMSLILISYLGSTGVVHLERDWQRAADLYQNRLQGVQEQGMTAEQLADLYRMRLVIESGASQWPDNRLFEPLAGSHFPVPDELSESARQQIAVEFMPEPGSRYSNAMLSFIMGLLSIILSIALLRFGIKSIKLKRLIEHVPTTAASGLSFGLSELKGLVRPDDLHPTITSKLSQAPCVAYKYDISERRGTGKKASWVTLESGEYSTPFWLEDDSGKALVYPEKANISYPEKYLRRQGRKRYTEYWLPPELNIYCLGFAGMDEHHPGNLAIQKDENNPYLITTKTEKEVVEGKGALGFLLTALSLGLFLFAATTSLSASSQLTPSDLLITALLVPVFLLVYVLILHYNDLIFLRNRAETAWSNIGTVLQRRHDLWPRLQSTVEAYLEHESQLLEDITQLRTTQAHKSDKAEELSEHLDHEIQTARKVIARAEDYPELKGNTVVEHFMAQMEATENYLSLLRNAYNDAVEIYNTRIQSLPDVILAKLFRFKSGNLFRARVDGGS